MVASANLESTFDPSDHPDHDRLRRQDAADVDGTLVVGRLRSAGDLLLRPACREPPLVTSSRPTGPQQMITTSIFSACVSIL